MRGSAHAGPACSNVAEYYSGRLPDRGAAWDEGVAGAVGRRPSRLTRSERGIWRSVASPMHWRERIRMRVGNCGEWAWQSVFPAVNRSRDPLKRGDAPAPSRRVDGSESDEGWSAAGRPATCHSLRHSFCDALLEDGYDTNNPWTARPLGRPDDDDLHACLEQRWRARSAKPARRRCRG